MRHTPWHTLAKRTAATTVVVLGLSGLSGCGQGGPDQQVHDALNKARVETAEGNPDVVRSAAKDVETAASNTDASEVVQAQAKQVLGQLHYDAALDTMRELDRREIEAQRLALETAELGRQVGLSTILVDGYRRLDPQSVRADIEQKIAEAKGGPDKPQWVAMQGKSSVPTLSAVQQQISNLEGQIAQKQAQAKQLDQQRVSLVEESDKLARQSERAKGRQSVDLFKQASDARKKASDLSTQMELVNASIVPLQHDLSVAQGQQQVLNGYIAELQEQAKTLDAGWQAVQKDMDAQLALAQQIATADVKVGPASQPAGGGEATGPAASAPASDEHFAGRSIVAKAKALADVNGQVDQLAASAVSDLEASVKAFNAAFTTANSAQQQLAQKISSDNNALQASRPAFELQKQVILPAQYKLAEARASRTLASVLAGRAANLATRMKVMEMVGQALQAAKVPVPKELVAENLKQEFDAAVKAASDAYDNAEQRAQDAAGAGGGGGADLASDIQKSAQVSLIFIRYGRSQLAALNGDQAGAQKYLADARDAAKAAHDAQAALPALPADVASAIPAPSTQPVTPTSLPSATTTPATAEGAASQPAGAAAPATAPAGATPPAATPPAGATPPGSTPPTPGPG